MFDVRDPRAPWRVAFVESVSLRGISRARRHLDVAEGVGELLVYNVDPARIEHVGSSPILEAHDVGVSWLWCDFVDDPSGLAVVDVRAAIAS